MAMRTIRGKELRPIVTRQDLQGLTLYCDKASSYSQEDNHNAEVITTIVRIMIIPYFQVELSFPYKRGCQNKRDRRNSFLVAARF